MIVVGQSLSCVPLCDPMDWSRPGFTISQSLLKLMSTESVMPSSHLILCHPLLFLPSVSPHLQGNLSNDLALHIRWPKYWNFSFSISPSNEYSGFISFRIDWLDLFAIQGTLRIHYFKTAPLSFNIYLPGELHFLSFFFKRWLLFSICLFSYLRCNLIEPEVNKRPSLHKFCSQRNWSWDWEISSVERWRNLVYREKEKNEGAGGERKRKN